MAEKTAVPSVGQVSRRIEHWRRTRLKRSPMPEVLWEAAAAIARERGVYATARDLRINYDSLRARLEQSGSKGNKATDAFVEFAPALLGPGAPTQRSAVVVELSRADGKKLVIRLANADELDVLALAREFIDERP
jgi:hypothetical protein